MVSLSEVPEVVYTNDELIDRLFSYLNEGQIQEVVERTLDSEGTEKGGGIDKILQLRYSSTSSDEEEQELIRELDSIGKFAILHRILQDDDEVIEFDQLSLEERDDLSEGEFIQTRNKITSTPISELQNKIDDFLPYFEMLDLDSSFEQDGEEFTLSEIQEFLDQLGAGEDIYRMNASDEIDSDIIFSSNDELDDFTTSYTEYYVLGRVEYIFEENEEEWLIDIIDLMPGNDRESRQQRRRFLRQITSGASELLEKDVDESDFKIGYPDIRIRPMAIYLY
ncbi:hypothetical protein [Natronococcus sp. A-GB7]|uniref:DUF6414 family protein n=1 Tax=Natronococcus sp. A-GB7 TaxID=3037649 RepID=UPI00241FC5A3|nr:hypothetical protein [Natronococcus sp. A-GB7]MDG5818520.1 hypothetical protein [Natronococcus sp. A-GB7]